MRLRLRAACVVVACAAGCGAPRAERGVANNGEPTPKNGPARHSAVAAPAPAASPVGPPPAVVPAPAPVPRVRRPGAYANLDPEDDYVVGPPEPYTACEAELTALGVKFRAARLPVHVPKKSKIACGAPQVVTYVRGPGKIAYNAAPVLTCTMALALASWERILQKEALAAFGTTVKRIDQLGTYNCREMAAYPGWVSEHSYANAIDIGRFVLDNGKSIEVLRDFDVGEAPPTKPAASFLRSVSRRAYDEDVFSHVLTPFFDSLHKNHFHLDLARFRNDGTRPQRASD